MLMISAVMEDYMTMSSDEENRSEDGYHTSEEFVWPTDVPSDDEHLDWIAYDDDSLNGNGSDDDSMSGNGSDDDTMSGSGTDDDDRVDGSDDDDMWSANGSDDGNRPEYDNNVSHVFYLLQLFGTTTYSSCFKLCR